MVVLNGTTLEDPVEMDLALPLVAAAIGRVGENIRLPVTDKLAVEVELLRLLRCRPVGGQYCSEARRAPEPQHLRADPGVLREPIRFPALAPVPSWLCPGEIGDEVGLPRPAAIVRIGLFVMMGIRLDVRPDTAQKD